MSTRSITIVKDGEREIVVLYRHCDGYPTGHGQELADYLATKPPHNGFDCLAASIVAHFKDGAYQFYLYPAGTRDVGEEWVYTVYPSAKGNTLMRVTAGIVTYFGLPGTRQENMRTLFNGKPEYFDAAEVEKVYDRIYTELSQDTGEILEAENR